MPKMYRTTLFSANLQNASCTLLLLCIVPCTRDLYSSLELSSVDAVLASNRASLTPATFRPEYPPSPPPLPSSSSSSNSVQNDDDDDDDDDNDEPMSDILYPIIPNLAMMMNGNNNRDVLLLNNNNSTSNNVTGLVSLSFHWRSYLQDLLPPTFDGMIVVLENPCKNDPSSSSSFSSFTYQINGPSAQFLGVGDQHDAQFNDMEQSAWLMKRGSRENVAYDDDDDDETEKSNAGATYTGIPVNEDSCPFLVRVYPSQIMQSRYATNSPITLTMASILVFVLTSCLFIVYDCWVERRQRKILQKAVHSIAIVSSLFPSVVRDRIFPVLTSTSAVASSSRILGGGGGENGENAAIMAAEETPKKRLKHLIRRSHSVGESTGSSQRGIGGGGVVCDYSKPVAELFPDSTVLFSDIAGFTAWRWVVVYTLCFYGLE
jgi:hypothetical protein